MPSLRIDQSDLMCKNGCDYYGNPQWQGYCSKCFLEQMHRQRRAEKASSATLPKPEAKKPERSLKLTSHSSFSKFEEKRLRQSETLKKANLLKFSVFKKSSTDEQEAAERRPPEFKIPAMVNEGMKRDFRIRFSNLPPEIDRDARRFAHSFIMDVIKCSNVMKTDELSERVQRQYQRFMKHMDTSAHFANVESETKELLMDFVEKHSMTYLHELPSVVFSPSGTEDERLDRAMSERIQQLSWVGEKHLECKLDRSSASCRQLLYKAISELLGMDAAQSPGGKVARVRRACRHVLALCAAAAPAPASADDLLPALIFTVLKANPPRLVSNINYVTRFCNAQRLMTGEGGYYFTNLCCAVSFIENLTFESLNMDKKEFDCYMAMPASIGGSAWAAALSLCGASKEAEEQKQQVDKLLQETEALRAKADQLANNADTFEKEITKKVQDVLAKTPLDIKPRRELPRLGSLNSTAILIDFDTEKKSQEQTQIVETSASQINNEMLESQTKNNQENLDQSKSFVPDSPSSDQDVQKLQEFSQYQELKNPPLKQDILDFTQSLDSQIPQKKDEPTITLSQMPDDLDKSPPRSPQNPWELKQTNSLELLTPSPLGFTPFDSRSIDELLTPDEFASDQAPGLSNVNYDIDLSDFSGDNSLADDTPREPKDPFSPEPKKPFDPFAQRDPFSPILDKFDEFSLVNTKTNEASDAFEVVHRASSSRDPFSPHMQEFAERAPDSLLDDSHSPSSACLLPSPLLPQTSKPQ